MVYSRPARLGAILLPLVLVGLAAPGATQAVPTATLPAGTTYWRVTDFQGVDCAECGGYRVLRRTATTRARLAYITKYDNGTKSVSCITLTRNRAGSWRDPYRTTWMTTGKKLEASGSGWWVLMSRAPKSAVTKSLDTAALRRAYTKCLTG